MLFFHFECTKTRRKRSVKSGVGNITRGKNPKLGANDKIWWLLLYSIIHVGYKVSGDSRGKGSYICTVCRKPTLTDKHFTRILNELLDPNKEGYGLPTIKQTMVVSQGKVHHLHVLAYLIRI